jgi:hypothetical protein
MRLGNNNYTFVGLDKNSYAYYIMLTTEWAKKKYNQLEDFIVKIKHWTDKDKQMALIGFMSRANWDCPSELQLRTIQTSVNGTQLLASLCLDPQPNYEDINTINETNCKDIYVKLVGGDQPTDEEVVEFNKKMRAKIDGMLNA